MRIEPAGGDTATPLNLRKRLALIERFAAPLGKRRVLDCGCGAGEYVRALRACGADAFGIEFDEGKLATAAVRDDDLAARLYPFETHGVFWCGTGRRVPHTIPGIPWIPLSLGTRLFDYWARN